MAPAGVISVKSPEAFRTISEVAAMLDVPQHVLRFWETRFTQIKPIKRAGGRRFYRPEDVDLLRGIQLLLYYEGYTIRGAQKILREKGVRYAATLGRGQGKNGSAGAPAVEEIAPAIKEENTFAAFAAPADDLEVALEAPVAATEIARSDNPRRLKLQTLRSELLDLKSRIAAARHAVA